MKRGRLLIGNITRMTIPFTFLVREDSLQDIAHQGIHGQAMRDGNLIGPIEGARTEAHRPLNWLLFRWERRTPKAMGRLSLHLD